MSAGGSSWYFIATMFFMGAILVAGLTTLGIVIRRRGVVDGPGRLESGAPVTPLAVTRNAPSKNKKKYFGVVVQPGINPCPGIEKIRDKRYLTLEAPKLPFPNCSQ